MKSILTAAFAALTFQLAAQPDIEKRLQTQLILAEDGDIIQLPAGRITLAGTLSLDGKNRITLRGAGRDSTILSFKNQRSGAEGIKISNAQHIVLQGFTVEDSKGDLIKAQAVRDLTFREITARWTGKPRKTNGSYAFYPVQCSQVLIEQCTAIGASDAGIYVGQSDSVWVKNCTAKWNVAGIEIENTTNAWVSGNVATENSGGILVFDLPGLLKARGGHVEVWNNRVFKNNHRNFAPKGNIVGKVPPGTGVMILATNDVNIRHNRIEENCTASCTIASYFMTEIPIKDTTYNPYPSGIFVHENFFSPGKRMPTWRNKLGFLFWWKFGRSVPHVLYDGIQNPAFLAADGSVLPQHRICVRGNENGTFANLHADKNFKKISRDLGAFDCGF